MSTITTPEGVQVLAEVSPAQAEILTTEALALVAKLHREFEPRREELLAKRVERAKEIDAGVDPDFLPETKHIRDDPSWKVAPAPADLQDRRAEITGPVDRKMIINALNSGAKVFMSDFEDSNTPTWSNTIDGQINLRDAVNGTISFSSSGKEYALGENLATLLVRPRGWHLREKHVLIDGDQVSAGIFDFALYMFHNAKNLLAKGSGPYFYLPKMESHLEARLWNDIIVMTQDEIGVPQGSVRATVLIETILAAFEMEEILYELRDHSAGLNCGRWDYIFSCIKKFRTRPDFVLADRVLVTMTTHFLNSLLAAGDQDLPQARRARDRRHGRADPDQERPRRQRGGPRQGEGRQGARGRQRPRRHLGRAPGPRRRSRSTPSTRSCRARTSSTGCARTWTSARRTSSTSAPRGRSPRPACASTSASACSTWAPG